jgi:hypothetical protein
MGMQQLKNLIGVGLLSLAGIASALNVPAAPASVTMIHGTLGGGTFASMLLSDNLRLEMASRPSTGPRPLAPHMISCTIKLQAVPVPFFQARHIQYQIEARRTSPGGCFVTPFNYTANGFMPPFVTSFLLGDTTRTLNLSSAFTARQFVNPFGELTLQVTAFGAQPFRMDIDRVAAMLSD